MAAAGSGVERDDNYNDVSSASVWSVTSQPILPYGQCYRRKTQRLRAESKHASCSNSCDDVGHRLCTTTHRITISESATFWCCIETDPVTENARDIVYSGTKWTAVLLYVDTSTVGAIYGSWSELNVSLLMI